MSVLNLWRGVALFDGLDDDQLNALITISQTEVYHDGDVVFNQETTGDRIYFVREGQVEVLIQHAPGEAARSQVFLGRGQIFGEMALLDEGLRSATVRASYDNTHLDVITRDDFLQLCATRTDIGFVVMRNMAMDLSFKLRHQNLDSGAGQR